MLVGIVARVVAIIFLLFHASIFIGVAISSLRELVARQPDTNLFYSILLLLFSFVLTVWVWGLIQHVLKKGWPGKIRSHVEADKKKYLATLLILAGLFLLFKSPLGFYAALGHIAGTNFGQMARLEYLQLLKVDLPAVLISFVAWVFQWLYASFMVGFIVWVYSALSGAVAGRKKTA